MEGIFEIEIGERRAEEEEEEEKEEDDCGVVFCCHCIKAYMIPYGTVEASTMFPEEPN